MTQHDEPLTRQISEIMRDAETELLEVVSADPAAHPARVALDQEMREIKDNVLRMGSAVEDAIRAAIQAAYTPDVPVSEEPGLVSLAVWQWQVGWRRHPGPTRPS